MSTFVTFTFFVGRPARLWRMVLGFWGGEEEEQISRSVSSGSDIDPAKRASARPSDVGRLTRTWAVSH